jgi:simple sugar transport system permease protein
MPETQLQKLGARFGGRIEPLLVAVIMVLCIVLGGQTPYFLTVSNWVDLIETYSVTAIFAMGLLVVLVAGGIDISFTAVASVAQYTTAIVATRYGAPAFIALPLCLLIGVVLGCAAATASTIALVRRYL